MVIEYCDKSKVYVATGHVYGRFVIAEAESPVGALYAWVQAYACSGVQQ